MARPRAESTTPQFSFRLDPELRRDLELLAAADDRSLGYYIERVMREHRNDNRAMIAELSRKAGKGIPYPERGDDDLADAAEESTPEGKHNSGPAAAQTQVEADSQKMSEAALQHGTPPARRRRRKRAGDASKA